MSMAPHRGSTWDMGQPGLWVPGCCSVLHCRAGEMPNLFSPDDAVATRTERHVQQPETVGAKCRISPKARGRGRRGQRAWLAGDSAASGLRDRKPRSSDSRERQRGAPGVPLPAEGGRHRGGGGRSARTGTGGRRDRSAGAQPAESGVHTPRVAQRAPRPRAAPSPPG